MALLIMMRHGESEWNKENQFTGWVDIPLSKKGIEEALEGGRQIKNLPIDIIFMSSLIRSHLTAMLAMSEHSSGKIPIILHDGEGKLDEWAKIYNPKAQEKTLPVIRSWHLNERMYGELQGLNKAETAEKYGADQVQIWRRSYRTPPPNGESLEMTAQRTIPYYEETIVPMLKSGKNVFVSAHGNSLRSILMDLDGLSEDEVVKLEVPTGVPIIYEFSGENYEKITVEEANARNLSR